MPISFHALSLSLPLLAVCLCSKGVLAQPDTAPRAITTPRDLSTLTIAQLNALVGGPTQITYSGREVYIDSIANVFLKAANLTVDAPELLTAADTPKTLTVEWNNVPFWTAAREFEKLSGLHWSSHLKGGLGLQPPSFANEASMDGLEGATNPYVKVFATSITRDSSATASLVPDVKNLDATYDSAQLRIGVYLDPKLRVERFAIRDVQCRTLDGLLDNPRRDESYYDPPESASRLMMKYAIYLPGGLHAGTKINLVSGVFHITLVPPSLLWLVPDIAVTPNSTKVAGPVEYTMDNVQVQGGALQLRTTLTYKRKSEAPLNVAKIFSKLRLRDAQGRDLPFKIISRNDGTIPDGRGRIQQVLWCLLKDTQGQTFQGPFSLEWLLPTDSNSIDVPFEFHDIRVP